MTAEQTDRPIQERWAEVVQHVKDEYLSDAQRWPWIVGFSGGKDSTVVAHAVFEALATVPPSQRSRPVHIVSNDTMVESPLVMAHLDLASVAQEVSYYLGWLKRLADQEGAYRKVPGQR